MNLSTKERDYEQDKLIDWLKEEQSKLDREPKIMYAIAYEMFFHGSWNARLEYVHAENIGRARVNWAAGVPKGFKMGFNARLVGIAPVIGVFVEDEKKEIYSV